MVAPAVAEVEDIPTGTSLTQAATTTPVAIPMGTKTYGLDIVVKFGTFPGLTRSDILLRLDLILSHLSSVTACDASFPVSISFSSQDHILTA
jgi:hypothetical protein